MCVESPPDWNVSAVSREPQSPHGVVMVWREQVTYEQNQSHFYGACLVCPVSFLYWPIFIDNNQPPQLTETYITVTNQRLQSFFLWLHI